MKYSGWEAFLRKWHLNQDWREEMPGRHQAMQEKALGGESGKQNRRVASLLELEWVKGRWGEAGSEEGRRGS